MKIWGLINLRYKGIILLIVLSLLSVSCSRKHHILFLTSHDLTSSTNNMLDSVISSLEDNSIVYKNTFTEKIREPDAVIRAYYSYSDSYLTDLARMSAYNYFQSLNLPNVDFVFTEKAESSDYTVYITSLEKKVLAPVTIFYDKTINATTEDVANRFFEIKNIYDVGLPDKAIAFNNLYPDDENYGLIRDTILEIEFKDKKIKTGKFLSRWITSLKESIILTETSAAITWIGAAGDILPARGVGEILLYRKNGIREIFSNTLDILKTRNIMIGNLEGAVTNSRDMLDKSFNFRFPPEILKPLSEAGFNYLSITNNHSFDFGVQGFFDTLSSLKKYNIASSGAGKSLAEASVPWSTNIKGTRINIISMADYPPERNFRGRPETEAGENKPGVLWLSDQTIDLIRNFSSEESFDIVCVHGGFEWISKPSQRQIDFYRKLADAGADLVIGTHPHVLQPVEIYNSSVIAYSLGNFIFPGMGGMEYAEETVILSAGLIDGKVRYLDFHPVKIDGRYISIDKEGTIAERFKNMNRLFYMSD